MWRDPIGYRGGVNVYGYAEGMVTIEIDQMGLKAVLLDWDPQKSKKTGQQFERYIPAGWGNIIEKYDAILDVLENELDDALFDKWKKKLTKRKKLPCIRFNGEAWTKSRTELIQTIKREKESMWLVQTSGGAEVAARKLQELGAQLKEQWDELGFAAHGFGDGNFLSPSGKPAPRDPDLNKTIRNAGMKHHKFVMGVCYRINLKTKEGVGFSGGSSGFGITKNKKSEICSLWMNIFPITIGKQLTVGDEKPYTVWGDEKYEK